MKVTTKEMVVVTPSEHHDAGDDGLVDEAMQYKNASSQRSKRLNKRVIIESALRSSSSSSSTPSSSATRVSFSDNDAGNTPTTNKNKKKSSPSSSVTPSLKLRNKNRQQQQTSNTRNSKTSNEADSSTNTPRKWRFSLFGGSNNSGSPKLQHRSSSRKGYGTLGDSTDDLDDPTSSSTKEPDPVMTIFESRNTQRVRFTLEGGGGSTGGTSTPSSNENGRSRRTATNASRKSNSASVSFSGTDGITGIGTTTTTEKRHNSNNGGGGNNNSGNNSTGNIKQFMSRALFGSSSSSSSRNGSNNNDNKQLLEEEMAREVKEISADESLIWESAATPTGPEVIHTQNSKERQAELLLSFTEDPKARAAVTKLLAKARKAEHIHFRYEYAVKCYLKAVNILKRAKYPDDHPTVTKTVGLLNNAHHVLSSYNNSANIVKMGIKNEDAGELVKALKMYTIAYRIRRDNLSRNHPSLVVLLNMLGSIQIKRGELKEAMQIYELALNDSPVLFSAVSTDEGDVNNNEHPIENLLARSVTYREMGTIHEMWGNVDEALNFYHKSLECVAEWRETIPNSNATTVNLQHNSGLAGVLDKNEDPVSQNVVGGDEGSSGGSSSSQSTNSRGYSISNVQPMSFVGDKTDSSSSSHEHGEMELVFGAGGPAGSSGKPGSANVYERFFPVTEQYFTKDDDKPSDESSHADMDLSLTLHQIAQLYRAQGKFARALDAYEVALRGMKMALGKHHPNVAAVLGNIGNLQKEMGDLDGAYKTYQEVLGIESYRLGLSHPDVAITLHNIATIDAARGNHEHSLQLYRKVIGLQKKLFGEDNLSVAVTAACMGDVYEKIGELENSMDSFDDAVRIKSAVLGRHSIDVGRLLHKLGKLAFLRKEYVDAESYTARAILIYRLNKLGEDHEWFIDATRDTADIDAAIAMGTADTCEI